MNTLLQSVQAENAKVLGSKTWWILLVVLFGYTALMAAFMAFFISDMGEMLGSAVSGMDPLNGAQLIYSTGSSLGYVLPVIFGALLFTGEIRYRTLTPTFLATPNRLMVLGSKLIIALLYGALFGLAAVIGSVLPGAIIFELSGGEAMLGSPEIIWMLVRIVIAMMIWSAMGLGLGSVFTNQITAIVLLLAFTQFVEPILRMVASLWEWSAQLGQYLPGSASDALVGTGLLSSIGVLEPGTGGISQSLDWWAGGLVLLALALVLLVIGYFSSWRKDVS